MFFSFSELSDMSTYESWITKDLYYTIDLSVYMQDAVYSFSISLLICCFSDHRHAEFLLDSWIHNRLVHLPFLQCLQGEMPYKKKLNFCSVYSKKWNKKYWLGDKSAWLKDVSL